MRTKHLIYSIDIGDSVIRAGVYRNGTTMMGGSRPTPQDPEGTQPADSELWSVVADAVRALSSRFPRPDGLALSASGTMTFQASRGARQYGPFQDREVIVNAPNVVGLQYAPILALVERLGFDLPVHVENDMNAALTAATQYEDAILIGLGAGLGAAVKVGGIIQHLPGTWSCFEIGHGARWPMESVYKRQCRCGTVGCLEAALGGWAMTERYLVAPEDAPVDLYAHMQDDVVSLLPQAIARLVKGTGISTVLMSGKGSMGYSMNPDFLKRLKANTDALVEGVSVDMQVIDLGEVAELHGSAIALINNVLDEMPQTVAPIGEAATAAGSGNSGMSAAV